MATEIDSNIPIDDPHKDVVDDNEMELAKDFDPRGVGGGERSIGGDDVEGEVETEEQEGEHPESEERRDDQENMSQNIPHPAQMQQDSPQPTQMQHDDHILSHPEKDNDDEFEQLMRGPSYRESDPKIIAQNELIERVAPTTELEIAMSDALKRKQIHLERLTAEITKLKTFISKRKQTYKRKRKDEGAPTRALSAYNIFVQERFARLAKENEKALKSEDIDAQMKRVPPANLVASTGGEWKELSAEEKAKYEERAKGDRKRYEEQMAQYQPPDKQANRKRNKTGYNMFFSAHVLRLKQTEAGVPSERGSVARLVGTAWKQLTSEDKQFYEREADKHNGMHPIKEGEEEDDEDEVKRQHMEHYHMHAAHPEMQMHPGMPPPMHPHPAHDPRHHHPYYAPHMYGQPPYAHYDYSQHHQRHQQARAHGYAQGYPGQRHPYDGGV